MEVILKFNDKGDDGSFEMTSAQRALRADEAFGVLYNIDSRLRSWEKYYEDISEKEYVRIEEIREMICETGLLDLYV